MKANCRNITEYVNKRMDKNGINNVSIGLPKLNKNTLMALKQNFKIVRIEGIMGYVHFER